MSSQCIEWFSSNKGPFTSRFAIYTEGGGEKGMKLSIFLGSSFPPASVSWAVRSEDSVKERVISSPGSFCLREHRRARKSEEAA